MRKDHESSRGARRGPRPTAGVKTRITIRLDDDVLAWFRRQVVADGSGGYQTLINLALRDYMAREPLEATLRRVVREELARAGGRSSPHEYGFEQSRPSLAADSGNAGAVYGASLKRRRRRRRTRKE